ncbi:MAG: N-acetylmuramoyl-L-alanine amidase [Blastocatellia bacterium]|nr:N-acetylmuramoyl-L-alanine amidase [Blastocatellia bacterium]
MEMPRQSFKQPDKKYAELVEQYSHLLALPAQRLKFIRSALERYHTNPLAERMVWLKEITFRKTIIEELIKHLPSNVPRPREVSFVFWLYKVRYPVYFTTISAAVLLGAITVQWTYAKISSSRFLSVGTALQTKQEPLQTPLQIKTTETQKVADDGVDVEGYGPEKIWLVEKAEQYEQYSNGCRVLTAYETKSAQRDFYSLKRKPTKQGTHSPVEAHRLVFYPEQHDNPIGILYHTTQSDILPFLPTYNQKLKGRTDYLLEYVKKEKLYNYLIDRFGRIYRVVDDSHYANHAGNSIWGDEESVYINLNNAFLGVAFEGMWSADVKFNPDEINEAQIYAGKMLTEVLRSKYRIKDINCVTHGLVSINPNDYLIGFHLDWATGFPFSKMGLRDKYLQAPPSISEFGFRYDKGFVKSIGGQVWPGITLAEARLRAEASDIGLSVEELRRQLQRDFSLYKQWLKQARERAGDSSDNAKELDGKMKGDRFSQ